MSIAKKLLLVFFLATFPVLVVGEYIIFNFAKNSLFSNSVESLEAVAHIQEERLGEILSKYFDILYVLSSDKEFSNYVFSKGVNIDRELIDNRIINILNNTDITGISLISREGIVLSSDHRELIGDDVSSENYFLTGSKEVAFEGILKDENNILRFSLVSPIFYNKEFAGVLRLEIDAEPLLSITGDYSSLGETGETIIARKNISGDAIFLTPLRFDTGAALSRVVTKDSDNVPIIGAINGVEAVYDQEGIVDYRGEKVLAVSRLIDSLGWGLVVKVDKKEVMLPIFNIGGVFIVVVFTFYALALLVWVVVSKFVFVDPIKRLSIFAQNVEVNNFKNRTDLEKNNDEIGFLAKSMNRMVDRIEKMYKNMEREIKSRVKDLNKSKKDLEKKLNETERLNAAMVDRELKMLELKEEMKNLKKKKSRL